MARTCLHAASVKGTSVHECMKAVPTSTERESWAIRGTHLQFLRNYINQGCTVFCAPYTSLKMSAPSYWQAKRLSPPIVPKVGHQLQGSWTSLRNERVGLHCTLVHPCDQKDQPRLPSLARTKHHRSRSSPSLQHPLQQILEGDDQASNWSKPQSDQNPRQLQQREQKRQRA